MTDDTRWQAWLAHAARLAVRGHGGAEPNPMVGCVVLDAAGALAGEGYHARCGEAHAEVNALARAGVRARGGTAVVTLEPCNHLGRTGPCAQALLAAGVAQVVYACTDDTTAAGGAAALRANGVRVLQVPSRAAALVTQPFQYRARTGLPWVALKWAQSRDGALARPAGEPRWLSGERSRAMVHRERGRVDAVLTGMGTVLADDPLLTARGVHTRRTALRVVWDPRCGLPLHARLVATAREVPLIVGVPPVAVAREAVHAHALEAAGVTLAPVADVRALLRWLRAERGVSTVLVEAGPGLMNALLAEGLANEAWVFVAPVTVAAAAVPRMPPLAADGTLHMAGFELLSTRMRERDVLLHYRAP